LGWLGRLWLHPKRRSPEKRSASGTPPRTNVCRVGSVMIALTRSASQGYDLQSWPLSVRGELVKPQTPKSSEAKNSYIVRRWISLYRRFSLASELFTAAELISTEGDARLRLVYVREDGGANFHSLAFDVLEADEWKARRFISRQDFQGEHHNRRWISDLHSFSPRSGVAVMQVAEGDQPTSALCATAFFYSWRSWDVFRNLEIARLKQCQSPFDPF